MSSPYRLELSISSILSRQRCSTGGNKVPDVTKKIMIDTYCGVGPSALPLLKGLESLRGMDMHP